MTTSRTSEEFLACLKLMVEVGAPLDERTVPGLLEAIDQVEQPSKEVNEIKGVLETLRQAEYSARLGNFTTGKIEALLKGPEPEVGEHDFDYTGMFHC